jgi:transposase
MRRAVARGRARKEARPIAYIGVDEKAFRTGHRDHTIGCDLARATVEFVTGDCKTASLAACDAQLTDAQQSALDAVAMDRREPYIGATREGLPEGDTQIVFDRFHIMRDMTKAVDTMRRQEHRRCFARRTVLHKVLGEKEAVHVVVRDLSNQTEARR